jgi:hypothetical protein
MGGAPTWDDAGVTQEPEPSVVEWGSDRVRRLLPVGGLPWWSYAAWVGAAAGSIAAFASLVSDWQMLADNIIPGPQGQEVSVGLGLVWIWGGGWVLGAMVLGACTGLALLGPGSSRAGARAVGLAAGGVLLPYLTAAAVALRRTNQSLFTMGNPQAEVELGPAIPLAFLATALLSVALWLAPRATTVTWPLRPGRAAVRHPISGRPDPAAGRPGPEDPSAPPDLTVEPAEPWVAPPEHDAGR